MEKISSMTDNDTPADPRADIEANARKIIMKTRESIAHLNGATSRRRSNGVSSSRGAALPVHARRRPATHANCACC